VGTWSRALRHLSEVLTEVVLIFEIWIIEKVHGSSFLLAESLCLSQSRGRFYFLLAAELLEGLRN